MHEVVVTCPKTSFTGITEMVEMRKAIKVAVAQKGHRSIMDFSKESGIYYGSIMWWVTGDRSPSLKNLERLAKAFDMTVSEFIALGES